MYANAQPTLSTLTWSMIPSREPYTGWFFLLNMSRLAIIHTHAQFQSFRQSILNSATPTLTITISNILSPSPPLCTVYSFFPLLPSSLPSPRWLCRHCSTARVKRKSSFCPDSRLAMKYITNNSPHLSVYITSRIRRHWSIHTVLENNIKSHIGGREVYSFQLTRYTKDEHTNRDEQWSYGTVSLLNFVFLFLVCLHAPSFSVNMFHLCDTYPHAGLLI